MQLINNQNIYKFITKKNCYILLILTGIFSAYISGLIYTFDLDLSTQDAGKYKRISEDIKQFLFIDNFYSQRILGPFLVWIFSNLTSIDVENSYKILSYFLFIILLLITFDFFCKHKVETRLAFGFTILLYYSHWVVLYNLFNIYQLNDLLVYIFCILILNSIFIKNLKKLTFYGLLAILTKQNLILLVLLSFITFYLQTKNLKIFKSLFIIIIIFLIINNFAGINSLNSDVKFYQNINNYVFDKLFNFYFFYKAYIVDKNFFIFFPFIIFLIDKNLIKLLKKHFLIIIYSLIIILYPVINYDIMGDNFQRVSYQGFFLIAVLLAFHFGRSVKENIIQNLIFISPLVILAEYLILVLNYKQSGFFMYMTQVRVNNLFNSITILCLMFVFFIFYKNFIKK